MNSLSYKGSWSEPRSLFVIKMDSYNFKTSRPYCPAHLVTKCIHVFNFKTLRKKVYGIFLPNSVLFYNDVPLLVCSQFRRCVALFLEGMFVFNVFLMGVYVPRNNLPFSSKCKTVLPRLYVPQPCELNLHEIAVREQSQTHTMEESLNSFLLWGWECEKCPPLCPTPKTKLSNHYFLFDCNGSGSYLTHQQCHTENPLWLQCKPYNIMFKATFEACRLWNSVIDTKLLLLHRVSWKATSKF